MLALIITVLVITVSVPSPTSHQISCVDPATSYHLATRTATTLSSLTTLISKARLAQSEFSKLGFEKRRDVLRSLLKFTVENRDVVCRMSCRDSGKSLIDANFGEIIPTCEKLLWTVANGERILSPEHRESGRISMMQSARVEYYPVGVVGAIVSWNYPFHNVMGPIISAIMAGNACVVKVSEHVAFSTPYLQSIISGALRVNGVSEDLVRLVDGFGETGEALIGLCDKSWRYARQSRREREERLIEVVGKLVMRKASETITPVILELGGKDAAIICEDADIENVIEFCTRAAIQNAGQNCAGLERMIVHESVYEEVVGRMKGVMGSVRIGCGLEALVDMGAVTMRSQIGKIQELVDDAVCKGATLECGGTAFIHPLHPNGQFYQPTLLTNVTPDMRLFHEEIFGPVLVIYTFTTDQQAIDLSNACKFGLSGSVFTRDYVRGERIAAALNVGMSNVNGWGVNYLCQALPFGGVGKSGFDRFAGVEGLRGNCTSYILHCRKTNWVRTRVPPILNYPIQEKSVAFQGALLELMYGDGIRSRIGACIGLVKILIGM